MGDWRCLPDPVGGCHEVEAGAGIGWVLILSHCCSRLRGMKSSKSGDFVCHIQSPGLIGVRDDSRSLPFARIMPPRPACPASKSLFIRAAPVLGNK